MILTISNYFSYSTFDEKFISRRYYYSVFILGSKDNLWFNNRRTVWFLSAESPFPTADYLIFYQLIISILSANYLNSISWLSQFYQSVISISLADYFNLHLLIISILSADYLTLNNWLSDFHIWFSPFYQKIILFFISWLSQFSSVNYLIFIRKKTFFSYLEAFWSLEHFVLN